MRTWRRTAAIIVCGVLIVSGAARSTRAAAWVQQQRLVADDAADGDQFGGSVSLSGNTLVVGAAYNDDNGSRSGSAYVFERTGATWTQTIKLLASDADGSNYFGRSAAVSGTTVFVGAPYNSDNGTYSGSAYIFEKSGATWSETQKLIATDAAAYGRFGSAVCVDGDFAVVGAAGTDCGTTTRVGAVYLYDKVGGTWTESVKLMASDPLQGDHFGEAVAIDENRLIVGTPDKNVGGYSHGAAYIFEDNGTAWVQTAKLTASDGYADDQFGISVDIRGDYAVVGAPSNDDNGDASGSAYVFRKQGDTWSEVGKLLLSDAAGGDEFGTSVGIDEGRAFVGAIGDAYCTGLVAVFEDNGTDWEETCRILGPAGSYNFFGNALSLDGDTLLVGASWELNSEEYWYDVGAAYLFTPIPEPTTMLLVGTGLAGFIGFARRRRH